MPRFLLVLFAIALAAPAQTTDVRSAAAIIQRFNETAGWAGKFDATLSLRSEGTLDGAPVTFQARQPSLLRIDITMGKDHIIQAYDGSFGWRQVIGEHAQGPAALTGPALDRLIDKASNAIGGPLVAADARGNQVEDEGRTTIDGKPCLKLKVTLLSGAVMRAYLDPDTFHEVREETLAAEPKSGVTEETVMDDFRTFGGILFPCRILSRAQGDSKWRELRIEKITLNPDIVPGIFSMPVSPPNTH